MLEESIKVLAKEVPLLKIDLIDRLSTLEVYCKALINSTSSGSPLPEPSQQSKILFLEPIQKSRVL